jgi:hypothetical protein
MPKTEADSPLTLAQVQELLQIALNTYHEQAGLCMNAKAPLASCIMLGATVEAVLTAVTCLLFEEALRTGKAPKYTKGVRKGETLDLLDWKFFQLLDVAKAAKWLPENLYLEERLDRRGVKGPVAIDTIRKVRNLVHPALYLKDRKGKEYTLEELLTLYATCHAAYDCLVKKLYERFPKLPAKKPI